jgi:hypothetical protein
MRGQTEFDKDGMYVERRKEKGRTDGRKEGRGETLIWKGKKEG